MIAACLKWVDHRPEVDPLSGEVRTDPRSSGASAADEAALEWALRLGEAAGDDVVALTAGPPDAEVVLREALSAGAERAIRVDLPITASSPAVAAAIATAMPRGVRVVLCGACSLDRGSGSVPAFLAARLGAAQALGLITVNIAVGSPTAATGSSPTGSSARGSSPAGTPDITGGRRLDITAERRLDGGRRERLRIPTPAVISVEGSSARLRRAALPRWIEARRAAIAVHQVRAEPGAAITTGPGRTRPFRPRARVLAAPAGALSAQQRILALTGALVDRDPPQTLVLDPREAATELLDHLRRWGYLP